MQLLHKEQIEIFLDLNGLDGPLKPTVCSRVCITLPASPNMRITASWERLKNVALLIALATARGSPYHSRPNGSASEIRSKPR
jgi:hypothetical protein